MNPKHLYPAHLAYLKSMAYCGTRYPIRITDELKMVTCKRCIRSIATARKAGLFPRVSNGQNSR